MLAQLEEALLQAAAAGKDGFDSEGADRLYLLAFTGYGLDWGKLAHDEAATRIRKSAIAPELVDAWTTGLVG